MSPFAALGLDEDADERAVKRAYAQRLRSTRPDEDPEGFRVRLRRAAAGLDAIPDPTPSPPVGGPRNPGDTARSRRAGWRRVISLTASGE